MIDKLIIVAGPSCSGKTNFVKRLRVGEFANLISELDLSDPADWQLADVFFMRPDEVESLAQGEPGDLLAHWTIPHPSFKLLVRRIFTRNAHDRQHRIDLIRSAKSVVCLTLYANPDELCDRIDQRESRVREIYAEGRDSRWKFRRKIRHLEELRRTYRSRKRTNKMYQRWFRFMAEVGVRDHFLVDYNDLPILQRAVDWPKF